MKKRIFLILMLINILACKAQEGRIEELGTVYRYEITSGTYLKDMNNRMSYYTGIWKGEYEGKYIFLLITKSTKNKHTNGDGSYWYEDEMFGRYELYSGNPEMPSTTIIASSMNSPLPAPIFSVGTGINNQFKFAYSDPQFCNAEGELILRRNLSNPNQLTYLFSPRGHFVFDPDCPYNGTIPVPLPNAVITLTKVN
ncbi:hypothetical protein EQG63_03830 [Flavobacterium amnicola]|uniref:DUF6705 domain-containing protein n=1 Tax=Flavobacterium amnicola TaxID=2506422 RepID=A0A4Q1K906_9FLAO|nr:DUF6705 family protein [Flavobacterium amnicola]RXR21079.1 hypothetical protein EQG63_03830 [Flavobacterium amnicola]